MEEELEEG